MLQKDKKEAMRQAGLNRVGQAHRQCPVHCKSTPVTGFIALGTTHTHGIPTLKSNNAFVTQRSGPQCFMCSWSNTGRRKLHRRPGERRPFHRWRPNSSLGPACRPQNTPVGTDGMMALLSQCIIACPSIAYWASIHCSKLHHALCSAE